MGAVAGKAIIISMQDYPKILFGYPGFWKVYRKPLKNLGFRNISCQGKRAVNRIYKWLTKSKLLKAKSVRQESLHTMMVKMLIEHSSIQEIEMKVQGMSMWPSIHPGDTVLAVRTDPDSLRIGDIVVFQHLSERMIMHRIIKKGIISGKPYMIQTQGDNSLDPDPPISYKKVICRVSISSQVKNTRLN